jgi:hypothetical protein
LKCSESRSLPSTSQTDGGFGPHHDPFLFCGRCSLCQCEGTSIHAERSLLSVLRESYPSAITPPPPPPHSPINHDLPSFEQDLMKLIYSTLPRADTSKSIPLSPASTLPSEHLPQIHCQVQGILVPLDSPLFQLWRIFAHSDLFLYIVIHCE